jgi:hypothetical protein
LGGHWDSSFLGPGEVLGYGMYSYLGSFGRFARGNTLPLAMLTWQKPRETLVSKLLMVVLKLQVNCTCVGTCA